jgi:acetyl esterase/lipase
MKPSCCFLLRAFAFFLPLASTLAQREKPALEGVTIHRDLPYVDSGHARQKLDLYLPEKSEGKLPVILWIHGGAWAAGSKDQCPAVRYTKEGYAVASLGYRLSSDAIFPAQIEDCKAAVRWLRAHADQYHLDSAHFAAWGSSAGGHLVALLGASGEAGEFEVGANLDQSSRVQAVCDFFGPTDLLQMDAHAIPEARLKHDPANSPESRLIGGAIQENKSKAARANPIGYIGKQTPPYLIVHGDKDPTVPHHQSELLFDALKKAGISAHFHTIKGEGHGGPGFNSRDVTEMVSAFFERHLKGGGDKEPLAKTSESQVTAAATPQAKGVAPARGAISWEMISRREDKNGDGRVTKEEFTGPALLFQRLDRNGDNVLTKEEVDSR